jgi:hypothetical protein
VLVNPFTSQVVDKEILGALNWEFQSKGSFTKDLFPEVPGPHGKPKIVRPQMKVLKGYTFTGAKGDLLKAFIKLSPGNLDEVVAKTNAGMKMHDSKAADLTTGEYLVYQGLFIAASLQVLKGHDCWDPPLEERRFRTHPNFNQYMSRKRFDLIKSSCLSPWTDHTLAGEDPWYEIRPLVTALNENRKREVISSELLVADEVMSAYKPRTSPTGDLAHVSFVERKPKNLGTEFKSIHDGRHGLTLFLEIQEGKDSMARKRFRDSMNPATATALRLALGALGRSD